MSEDPIADPWPFVQRQAANDHNPDFGTAREILPKSMYLSDEWHAIKRVTVSATDLPAIMGVSPWDTAFSLYWRKVAGIAKKQTPEMARGMAFEAFIYDQWSNEAMGLYGGQPLITWARESGLLANIEQPWKVATPDALVGTVDSPVWPAEFKTTATWADWGPEWTQDVPDHYRAQVAWQAHVLGVDDGYLAALMPDHTIRSYQIHVTELEHELMAEAASEFRDRHLLAGQPPQLSGAASEANILKQVWPAPVDGSHVNIDADLIEQLEYHRRASNDEAAIAKQYEARIRLLMTGAQQASDPTGRIWVTRSVQARVGYQVKPSIVDQLRITHRKEDTP